MGPDTTRDMNFDELSPLPQPQTFATQINCVIGLFSLMMLRSCLMQFFKDFILQFHTHYTVLCHSGISCCLIMYSIFITFQTTYPNTHDSNALQLLVNGRMSGSGITSGQISNERVFPRSLFSSFFRLCFCRYGRKLRSTLRAPWTCPQF